MPDYYRGRAGLVLPYPARLAGRAPAQRRSTSGHFSVSATRQNSDQTVSLGAMALATVRTRRVSLPSSLTGTTGWAVLGRRGDWGILGSVGVFPGAQGVFKPPLNIRSLSILSATTTKPTTPPPAHTTPKPPPPPTIEDHHNTPSPRPVDPPPHSSPTTHRFHPPRHRPRSIQLDTRFREEVAGVLTDSSLRSE